MKYLITTTEVYRVDTEAEAQALIEAAKADSHFILNKYVSEYKERKSKGEVIDEYFKVSLVKSFTDIKEPDTQVSVEYTVE